MCNPSGKEISTKVVVVSPCLSVYTVFSIIISGSIFHVVIMKTWRLAWATVLLGTHTHYALNVHL